MLTNIGSCKVHHNMLTGLGVGVEQISIFFFEYLERTRVYRRGDVGTIPKYNTKTVNYMKLLK